MPKSPPEARPRIIPYLYYDDAGSAIEFMEKAFGFEIESAFRAPENDRVLHAQGQRWTFAQPVEQEGA